MLARRSQDSPHLSTYVTVESLQPCWIDPPDRRIAHLLTQVHLSAREDSSSPPVVNPPTISCYLPSDKRWSSPESRISGGSESRHKVPPTASELASEKHFLTGDRVRPAYQEIPHDINPATRDNNFSWITHFHQSTPFRSRAEPSFGQVNLS